MKKFLCLIVTLSVFLLGSMSTASATLIESWDFNLQYGFSAFTDGDPGGTHPVVGSSPNADFNNYPTTLSWGLPYFPNVTQSSIVVDPASNMGTTALDVVNAGPSLTHNNFEILLGSGVLESATLSSSLSLTPTGLAEWPPTTREFEIGFVETPNNDGPDGNGPVDDIFWIKGLSDFQEGFTVDDYYYEVTFMVDGLVELDDVAKAYLGLSPDDEAWGFTTPEFTSSTFSTSFSISARPIPEPATLFLMGIGLIGIAGLGRKKQLS